MLWNERERIVLPQLDFIASTGPRTNNGGSIELETRTKDGIYADERDSVIGLALSRVNKPKIKPPSDYESEGDNDGTKL